MNTDISHADVIHNILSSNLTLYLSVTLGSSLEVYKPLSPQIPPQQVCPMEIAHLYWSLQISRVFSETPVKLLKC